MLTREGEPVVGPCGKRSYTFDEAGHMARTAKRARGRKARLSPYRCPGCRVWHLTTVDILNRRRTMSRRRRR